jgi:diketogulonate reductase-like aldo/keto reductase
MWVEMEKLVDEGLVDTIGVSNFSEEEVQAILDVARHKPVSNQVRTDG